MSSPRRHPPEIYRRRRIALLVLVIIIALVVWGVVSCVTHGAAQSDADGSAAPATTDPVTSASPSADASTSAQPTTEPSASAEAAACESSDLSVSVRTSASTYSFTQQPEFIYEITNIASVPCSTNVGTAQQQLVVGSGQAEIWKLTPCISNPSDDVQVLQPNDPLSGTVKWDLSFNDGKTCSKERKATVAGTYWVQASIGSISSQQYAFVLQ